MMIDNEMTILEFGGSYLMVETVKELRERGVSIDVRMFDWGTIGVIIDPEGNRIELKD